MTDEAKPATPPRMQILAQYIRDMSFENVAAQKNVKIEGTPQTTVKVGLDAQKRGDDQYEIINKVTIESKSGEQTVFILELEYAGQFHLTNVPTEQLHPFLMIECPRMLFPYLRRIVGDITRDGGFPPLNIDNIDYLALYRTELERRKAMEEKKGATVS